MEIQDQAQSVVPEAPDKQPTWIERCYDKQELRVEELKAVALSHVGDIEDDSWRTIIATLIRCADPAQFTALFREFMLWEFKRDGLVDEDGNPTDKLLAEGMSAKFDEWVESGRLVRNEDGTITASEEFIERMETEENCDD